MDYVPTSIPGDKPTDLTPFIYTPLELSQHTRTLRLEPSMDPKAPLCCSLQPVDLDKYPDYEALSYTWGPPEFTESLQVEQSGLLYLLKITPNLYHGLQRLRMAVTARYLWVDAVCIDQNDGNYKANQIPRMAQIYRQANNVIIWLGEHPAEAECLARLSKAVKRPHDELQLAEIRKDCEGLYSVPWFRRRWIIQEAVLNDDATILCGDSSTSLTRVIHAFTKFKHGFPIIHKIAELRRGRIWNQPISNAILTLLDSFAEAECSNDLDRLYALAGLSGDVKLVLMKDQSQENLPKSPPKILLPVNYEQDARYVYGSFAKALAEHYEAMSFFIKILVRASTRLQSQQHGIDGSWFPLWNLPVVRQPLQQPKHVFSESHAFVESLREGSVHQIVTYEKRQVVPDPEIGAVRGEIGLRITDLSIPCPAGCTASELCTWIQSVFHDIMKWAEAARAEGRYYRFTDGLFLITLFGVMTDWQSPNPQSESYSPDDPNARSYSPDDQGLKIFESICHGTRLITEFDLTQSPLREITRTVRKRRIVKWDSYLIKYSGGRDGGGPQNTRLVVPDRDELALLYLYSGQLVSPQTNSFRIGIAPDFADINDKLIVGPKKALCVLADGGGWNQGVSLGWYLRRGFILRLSQKQCEYGHRGVPHYNFIGECAVVHPWGARGFTRREYESWRTRAMDFDICLQ